MRIAPMGGARVAATNGRVKAPTLIRLVTGCAGHTVVAGEACIEEEQLTQLNLGVIHRGESFFVKGL